MKAIVISALISLSVCVLADVDDLRPPVFEVPHKWEQLQVDSVKVRNTMTHFVGILKGLVINDNPEVGQIIADKLDEVELESMQIIDRMDAEIQSKTLTTESVEEFFNKLHDTYHYKIKYLVEEFQQISAVTREVYLKTETKLIVALSTQEVDFRVPLIGN